MAAKIIAFLITFIVNIAVGVIVFFGMLVGMNGYSESDATYGFVTYFVLAVLVSLLMSSLAVVALHLLLKRQFSSIVAVLISVILFCVIGAVLKVICSSIGISVAEFVRVNF